MALRIAHNLDEKWRSDDIKLEENIDFSGLLLSDRVLEGLKKSGYVKPSPIQLRAIPLGRCGLDLIVQAKSGTGKTCVFTVIALENLLDSLVTQVLVLAPTREIAAQICDVVQNVGCEISDLNCCMFIGGLPIGDDKENLKKCQIAVGTPGRIKHLIEEGHLKTHSIRLFVLDEADKLLDKSFQENINWIYSSLPVNKQMLALSATYPEELATLLTNYMRNPAFVRLNVEDPALLGITQFYKLTSFHPMQHLIYQHKLEVLWKVLNAITFSQCLIFCNLQTRVQTLCDALNQRGYPSVYISGNQDQNLRLETMDQLKAFQCRVLVTTDLTSRGIDAENVNLVINMDVPYDVETYLHRIGRAGRYGTQGISITLAASGEEGNKLMSFKNQCHFKIHLLPDPMPADLWNFASKINATENLSLTADEKIEETVINGEKQVVVESHLSLLTTDKDQNIEQQSNNTLPEKASSTSKENPFSQQILDKVQRTAEDFLINSEPNNKILYVSDKKNVSYEEGDFQQKMEKSEEITEPLDSVGKNKSHESYEKQTENKKNADSAVNQKSDEQKLNSAVVNTEGNHLKSENDQKFFQKQDNMDSKENKHASENVGNLGQILESNKNVNFVNKAYCGTESDEVHKGKLFQYQTTENDYEHINNDHTYHNRTVESKQHNSDKCENFKKEEGLQLSVPLVEREKVLTVNDSVLNPKSVETKNAPDSENSSITNILKKTDAISSCHNTTSEINTIQSFNHIQSKQIVLENNEVIELSEEPPLSSIVPIVPTDDFFSTLLENLRKSNDFIAKSKTCMNSEMSNILQPLLRCESERNKGNFSYQEAVEDFEHFVKSGSHLNISKTPFDATRGVPNEFSENQLCILNSYLNQKNDEFLSEVHSSLKEIREISKEMCIEEQEENSENKKFSSDASFEKPVNHFQGLKKDICESPDVSSENIVLSKDTTLSSCSKTDSKDVNDRFSINEFKISHLTSMSNSEVLSLQSDITDSLDGLEKNTIKKDLLSNHVELYTEVVNKTFTADDINEITTQNDEKLTKEVKTLHKNSPKQPKHVELKSETIAKEFISEPACSAKKEPLMIEKKKNYKPILQKKRASATCSPVVDREIKLDSIERAVRKPLKTYIPSVSFENTKRKSYTSSSKQKSNTYKSSIFKHDKIFYAKNNTRKNVPNSNAWERKSSVKHSENAEQMKSSTANNGHNIGYEGTSETSSCSSEDLSLSFTSPQKSSHQPPEFVNGNYTPYSYYNTPDYDDKHQSQPSVERDREVNNRICYECQHYRDYYRYWQWYQLQHKNRAAFDFYRRYMEQWTYLQEMIQWWKH